jgi:AP endonuclease 2
LTGADINANIIGSDHCPVWATLSFPCNSVDSQESRTELLGAASESRRLPPRLCARYLSHAVPSQSIRALFNNVPGHIVLRSGKPVEADSTRSTDKNKKRESVDLNQTRTKKARNSVSGKGPSKVPSAAQRSMNDFLKIPHEKKTPSLEPRESEIEAQNVISASKDASFTPTSGASYARDSSISSASQQWTSIFTRKGPPLCDTHGLPCVELVTKKAGPNLGRKFWICSKPVGPGYDNGKSRNLEFVRSANTV